MKTLLIVAVANLLASASSLVADGDAGALKEVIALSQTGGHRLRLTSAEQVKSPWDENVHAVNLLFKLEYPQGGKQFASQPPENVFLESVRPLEEVLLMSGGNVAGNKHSAWTDESSSEVVIHTLEVGKEQRHLQKLKLVLTLVKVTEWQQLEFKGLKEGKNDTLHCGPFEIDCTGAARHFDASAGARSEFHQEHENFRRKMPLSFLHHRYAINHARITDTESRSLNSYAGTLTGGSSGGRFSIQEVMNLDNVAEKKTGDQIKPPGIERNAEALIAYPVTLELQLPTQYETERVVFEFGKLDLPAFKKR